jgi:hypothetical protein
MPPGDSPTCVKESLEIILVLPRRHIKPLPHEGERRESLIEVPDLLGGAAREERVEGRRVVLSNALK